MPPTSVGPTKRNIGACNSYRVNKMATQNDQVKNSDVDAQQFYAMDKDTTPTISIRTAGVFTNMSKALKQLELWHQRTGHLAPRTMRHTQKCVDGMPPLPDASPIFSCKFCDIAKQRKSNRGLPILSKNYKPGTAYHMDLGFIRGPDNLPEMVSQGTTKGKYAIEGRRGKTCYLLIIDAATRQLYGLSP